MILNWDYILKRGIKVSRYNLLHEPWIKVVDKNNQQEKVSMIDVFENAYKYKRISGETSPQDFAILRLLLAVLHTTFSRYKVDGSEPKDNPKAMQKTWQQLWKLGKFPKVVSEYLTSQEDKFFIYDDKYPFMQVTKKDLDNSGVDKVGTISGKLINRLLSESNNKVDLFAPTTEKDKNRLTNDQLARWLVAMQGYTGTSDKAKFPGMKEQKISASRGWLLSIGGVFLQGENLFQTLLLNLKLDDYKEQHPIWEKSLEQKTNFGEISNPKDLADIYTNCSRLIYINPEADFNKQNVEIEAVQLPAISDEAQYIEPMTLWQVPKSGKHKGENIPKLHQPGRALWRSFSSLGLIKEDDEPQDDTGIISWYNSDTVDEMIDTKMIKICAVGMPYNHDASGMPNGEFYDEVNVNPKVLFDNVPNGWVNAIIDEVKNTEDVINVATNVIKFLCELRNTSLDAANSFNEKLYFNVDKPFKEWISKMNINDDKTDCIFRWRQRLFSIVDAMLKDVIGKLTMHDLQIKYNKFTKREENIHQARAHAIGIIKYILNIKEE